LWPLVELRQANVAGANSVTRPHAAIILQEAPAASATLMARQNARMMEIAVDLGQLQDLAPLQLLDQLPQDQRLLEDT